MRVMGDYYGFPSPIASYIIEFLLGEGNGHLVERVSYGEDTSASVVIERSPFFEAGYYMSPASLPDLPLEELEGVPVLFGSAAMDSSGGKVVIHADLVASSFFLLTRYEECVRRGVRDEHGRFPGAESLPFRAGFIGRPVVDEYGALLRNALRSAGVDVREPAPGYRKVWLTHDVDTPWTWNSPYRVLRSIAGRVMRGESDKLLPLAAFIDYENRDPAFTFDWLVKQDERAQAALGGGNKCESLYFLMGCADRSLYDDGYMRKVSRTRKLVDRLATGGCAFGYHVSYNAASNPGLISEELSRVTEIAGCEITSSRNHYLDSREPEDYRHLVENGITDDYTMTYADVAGFRIGTCRPVRWIDPVRLELTDFVLHPTTVMECTLDSPKYMGIKDLSEAFRVVRELLDATFDNAGEAVLLWHNTSVQEDSKSYQRELYELVVDYIVESDAATRAYDAAHAEGPDAEG